MTAYAFIDGEGVAHELPNGAAFVLPTGESYPANWLALASQAEREAREIWPIVEPDPVPYEKVVSAETLVTTPGPIVTRTLTLADLSLDVLRDKMLAELDQLRFDGELHKGFFFPASYEASQDYAYFFKSDAYAFSTLLALAKAAEEAVANGAVAADYGWYADWAGSLSADAADFHLRSFYGAVHTLDAPTMVELGRVLTERLRRTNHWWNYFRYAVLNGHGNGSAANMLYWRSQYVQRNLWLIDTA